MPERVLAVDPSLRGTGFAVLERAGKLIASLEYGVIRNSSSILPSSCLVAINDRVRDLLTRWEPASMAIESVIYVQSYKTAITLGAARGSAIVAAAARGLPVYEYAPRRVKQAVVGNGAAQKEQVAFMVRAVLRLTETPPADAADALAIGLCHFQSSEASAARATTLLRI